MLIRAVAARSYISCKAIPAVRGKTFVTPHQRVCFDASRIAKFISSWTYWIYHRFHSLSFLCLAKFPLDCSAAVVQRWAPSRHLHSVSLVSFLIQITLFNLHSGIIRDNISQAELFSRRAAALSRSSIGGFFTAYSWLSSLILLVVAQHFSCLYVLWIRKRSFIEAYTKGSLSSGSLRSHHAAQR
jgi:hypothetical protein